MKKYFATWSKRERALDIEKALDKTLFSKNFHPFLDLTCKIVKYLKSITENEFWRWLVKRQFVCIQLRFFITLYLKVPSAKRHEIAFSESIYFHFFCSMKSFLALFSFCRRRWHDPIWITYALLKIYICIIVVHAQYYFYSIFFLFFAKGDGKMGQIFHFLKKFLRFFKFHKKVFELNFFVEFLSLKGPLLWNLLNIFCNFSIWNYFSLTIRL